MVFFRINSFEQVQGNEIAKSFQLLLLKSSNRLNYNPSNFFLFMNLLSENQIYKIFILKDF